MDLRVMLEPQQGATYDQRLAIAQAAEREGFDGFFRSDHLMRFDDEDPGPGPTESWITLAGIARETSRIRLGTMVTSMTYSAAVNVDIRANSADKVVDELSQFKEAGAERIYMQLLDNDDVEQVSVIAAEVKPQL